MQRAADPLIAMLLPTIEIILDLPEVSRSSVIRLETPVIIALLGMNANAVKTFPMPATNRLKTSTSKVDCTPVEMQVTLNITPSNALRLKRDTWLSYAAQYPSIEGEA